MSRAVRLDRDDVERIARLAKQRAKGKTFTRKKAAVFDDTSLYALGLIGEVAVERVFGLRVDERRGWDGGVDATTSDGLTVAVKMAHRRSSPLTVEGRDGDVPHRRLKDFRVDLAILVVGVCERDHCVCQRQWADVEYRVVGSISRGDFLALHRVGNWGYGVRYWVPQSCLRPPRFGLSAERRYTNDGEQRDDEGESSGAR